MDANANDEDEDEEVERKKVFAISVSTDRVQINTIDPFLISSWRLVNDEEDEDDDEEGEPRRRYCSRYFSVWTPGSDVVVDEAVDDKEEELWMLVSFRCWKKSAKCPDRPRTTFAYNNNIGGDDDEAAVAAAVWWLLLEFCCFTRTAVINGSVFRASARSALAEMKGDRSRRMSQMSKSSVLLERDSIDVGKGTDEAF